MNQHTSKSVATLHYGALINMLYDVLGGRGSLEGAKKKKLSKECFKPSPIFTRCSV